MPNDGNLDLNYVLEGPEDAPILVLANSLGTTLDMWDGQASALREHFRLLRYDHRGHGDSTVPDGPYELDDLGRDVLALLGRLEIENFSFCGLSLGGMVGMWLASHAPERVDRLVLCCTSAKLGPPENWSSRASTVRAEGLEAIADATMGRWFTDEFLDKDPETVGWARRMLRGIPPEGYAGCCEAIRDMDLTAKLGDIEAATLVIAGADDEAITLDHMELIRDSIPDARLEVIQQAAHLANVEQPGAVMQAILEHLAPAAETRRVR